VYQLFARRVLRNRFLESAGNFLAATKSVKRSM
jgi:hypothetical protein